ncbi:MAG: hypothetical protein KF688_09295 [Pirellulales bacterium]|nr:hypothetical protein [Pirellulales bacterium]
MANAGAARSKANLVAVAVHEPSGRDAELAESQSLALPTLVPGFALPLADVLRG